MNLLTNGNFSDPRRANVPGASGNVPFGWTGWYKYLPGRRKIPWDMTNETGYVAPEFKGTSAVAPYLSPSRHINGYGQCWFGQGKHLWSGMWQKVSVPVGAVLHFSVMAHGWSNGLANPKTKDNPFWSDGVGTGPYFRVADPNWPIISLNGDPIHDAEPNMVFDVGIDPLGGDDPFSANIKWGTTTHIYNVFAGVPEVVATSVNNIVTVFIRARTLWGFQHNDVYVAGASMLAENVPEEPNVHYVVVVNLLPQDATKVEKAQVLELIHTSKQTILQSADDALRLVAPGLPGSKVIVWGASRWGGREAIKAYLLPCVVEFVEW